MLSTTKMAAASSFTNLQRSYSALPSVLILGFGEHTHSFLTINAHLLPKISDECVFWMPKTWKIYLPKAQNTRVFPRMRPNSQQNGSHKISRIWGKINHTKSRVDHKIKASAPPHQGEPPGHPGTCKTTITTSPSPMEWRLPVETLRNLFCAFGTPLVDMFATAENKVYVSPYPDDRAWAVDALSISWDSLRMIYAFPPAPIVPKTLDRIRSSRGTTVILIASQHPSRPWHPLLLPKLSLRPRITLPEVELYQYVPNLRRPQFHRDPRLLDLAACLLSRNSSDSINSQNL